ncbi:MAG: MoaD family protein [Actinomycetota bacterium]|nr:MoaD family protein [Actinomycetota bacterium]
MPVKVNIPAVLRSAVGGSKSVEGQSGTLRDLLEGLGSQYPALREQVFGEDGGLHRFVNVYVNDEDVRYLDGLDTKVAEGDVVAILPAVAGGAF